MTREEQQTWKCDRCGLEQVEPLRNAKGEMNGLPDGWQTITVRRTWAPAGDLCDRCDNEYTIWWRSLSGTHDAEVLS